MDDTEKKLSVHSRPSIPGTMAGDERDDPLGRATALEHESNPARHRHASIHRTASVSPSRKRPAEVLAGHDAAAPEEPDTRGIANVPLKRARGDKEVDIAPHVSHLPPDVLLKIFSQLGVRSLACVMQVSRSWNAVANEFDLWKSVCTRVGLLNDAEGSPVQSHAAKLLERVKKLLTKMQTFRQNSSRRAKVRAQLTKAYRKHYKTLRNRVCANCLSVHSCSVAYYLFDGTPICSACRGLDYFAYITATYAKRFFKYGKVAVERPGQILYSNTIRFTHRSGTIYRFRDMVELSELAVGAEITAKRAEIARSVIGLREAKVAQLKDV